MTPLEKRSFYSFLALYLISSLLFLTIAAFWFYEAQRSSEESLLYYKMRHLADTISSEVINAHMHGSDFKLTSVPNGCLVALFDAQEQLKYGALYNLHVNFDVPFYFDGTTSVLISTGTNDHLGVHYVVVETQQFKTLLTQLQSTIALISLSVFVLIIFIAVMLSKIFMRPIHKKMHEIETFVKNTAHELNTPITALMMSTSRAQKKKIYDDKIMRNISISTKQLYDMYRSLTYLSFEQANEEATAIDFKEHVNNSINHFNELLQSKDISVHFKGTPCILQMVPNDADMLINNLLGNAIKYSLPHTKITITLSPRQFSITDEGIGIAKEELKNIFLRFRRANDYAGGFGVGLSIVKSICNAYNIHINVISKEAQGTQFLLNFNNISIK